MKYSLPVQCIEQKQLGEYDGRSLEEDGLPAVIAKRLNVEHLGIDIVGSL